MDRISLLLMLVVFTGCGSGSLNETGPGADSDKSSSVAASEIDPATNVAAPAAEDSDSTQTSDNKKQPTDAAVGNPKQQSPPRQAVEIPDLRTRKDGIDWPSFLGPHRDNKSPEQGILSQWPDGGPRIVWTRELGDPKHPQDYGYGIGVTSLGRFFQFDRFGPVNRLCCLNAETGDELWKFEYETEYQDILGYSNGPRCSPLVDADRVYLFDAAGVLHCVGVLNGEPIWKIDTTEKYGVVQNFFGVGSTPIIEGDLLIVNVGGSPPDSPTTYSGMVQGNGSGVVAFDKYTGEEIYRTTDELASYASPVVATIAQRRWCFVFARGGLLGLDPATGKMRFHFPFRSDSLESVNAATPLVIGDRVFITETYGVGSAMLTIAGESYEVDWTDRDKGRDKSMMCHWNTPIYHGGYLYGSSGRHLANAELRCVDAKDGKVIWSEPGLTRSTLLYADGHLICLSENGALRLLRATPEKFDMVTGVILKQPGADGRVLLDYPAWAPPMLSHGLLYVRGRDLLVCLELIPRKQ